MNIVKEPNSILHRKLVKVRLIDDATRAIIAIMREEMKKANGVGLAANQVGLDIQIFVIDKKIAQENNVPDAYINPEITEYSADKGSMEEGCLSLTDYWVEINRPKKIKIKALDEHGNKVRFKAKGFLARVLQHEYDHLNGLLIKDRFTS